jgi:hypothetical protein
MWTVQYCMFAQGKIIRFSVAPLSTCRLQSKGFRTTFQKKKNSSRGLDAQTLQWPKSRSNFGEFPKSWRSPWSQRPELGAFYAPHRAAFSGVSRNTNRVDWGLPAKAKEAILRKRVNNYCFETSSVSASEWPYFRVWVFLTGPSLEAGPGNRRFAVI